MHVTSLKPYCIFRVLKIVLIICSIIILCIWVAISINSYGSLSRPSDEPPDAIIVLGARSLKDGKPNPCLVARIDTATRYAESLSAKSIIVSGGNDTEDGVNEAQFMRDLIESKKNNDFLHIYLESKSSSTYENLLFSKQVTERNSFKKLLIITEPFHTLRVRLVAHKLGIHTTVIGASTSPCWSRWQIFSRYTLREIPALISYWIKGYI